MKNIIRQAIREQKTNAECRNQISIEIVIISVCVGLFSQSWWVFGGCILALGILINFKKTMIVFSVLMCIVWGGIGFALGQMIGGIPAGTVFCIFGILMAIGTHMSGFQHIKDVQQTGRDRNSQ